MLLIKIYQVVVTDGTVAGTHVLTDAGQIDPDGISATQVAGDDALAFTTPITLTPRATSNICTATRPSPMWSPTCSMLP